MNQKTLAGDRRRRKLMTSLWALGVSIAVIVLIYFEKTAILYVLCTLAVTVLLLIVAFADLHQGEPQGEPLAQTGNAARDAARGK